MPPKKAADFDAPTLKFTSFAVTGYINAKNVASGFAKAASHMHFDRNRGDQVWDDEREKKRRRLMASEEELELDGAEKVVNMSVLSSASTGAVHTPAAKTENVEEDQVSPSSRSSETPARGN